MASIHQAKEVVKANGLSDKVIVLHGRVEVKIFSMITSELVLHAISDMLNVDVYISCKMINWCSYVKTCDVNEYNGEFGIIYTLTPLLR